MPEENYQKIKLLKIMEILRQETDEEHPMTKVELAARLVAMNVSCSPRSLIRDIKLLNEQGYEIMERLIGHEKAYFVCDRSFSVPELKILIDAVQAASFVTNKKTGELIDKIAALGGSHRAAILKGNMVKFNTRKHRNETVYYTVGYLEDAIKQNRKVAFKYFDVTETGQRAFRRDGAEYVMEPVALVFNEDNYYLITYNEKHEATTNYRVDRIDSVRILDELTMLYRQLNLSPELKEKFVSDVRRITMEYVLTAESINVDKSDELAEILVLTIQLKKQEFDNRIVEAIARQNKHKLVFLLTYEDQQQLALYSSKLYKTSWMPAEEMKLEARGKNIPAIWEGFVEQIALTEEKPAAAPMSIEERLRRQEQIAKLRKDMEKLENKTRKEIQPKKKFELYQQVQALRKQLEEIE